jgi:hypothetical protein
MTDSVIHTLTFPEIAKFHYSSAAAASGGHKPRQVRSPCGASAPSIAGFENLPAIKCGVPSRSEGPAITHTGVPYNQSDEPTAGHR